MADDDDLWAQLYGEAPSEEDEPPPAPAAAAPPPPPPPPVNQPVAPAAEVEGGSPPPPPPDEEAAAPDDRDDDDDDDDLQIVLDAPAGGAYGDAAPAGDDDDDDDFDVQLDEDAVASAVPARPGGDAGELAATGAPPPPPGGPNFSNAFPAPPPPQAGAPGRPKPALPKYAVNMDLPPALPSQAAPGQRVRLPGQSRVTPEEYREFLGLGHGEIFNLDIDLVIDPPWEMPGIDITDFFNYGFTPDTWKEYCAEVHQFRVEFSMQKKISTMGGVAAAPPVFVDPDLPPELRAAVAAQRMGGVPQPMAPFAHGMPRGPPQAAYAAQTGGQAPEHAAQPLPPGVGPAAIAPHPGPRPPTAPHGLAYGPPGAAHGMPMHASAPGMGMGGPRPPYGGPHAGMMAPRPMMPPGGYGGMPPGMPMQGGYGGMYGMPVPQFAGQMQAGGVRPPYGHPAAPPPPQHPPTAQPPADAAPSRRARPDVDSLAMGMDVGSRRRDDDRRRRDDDRDRDHDHRRSRRSRSRSRERSRRY